MTKLAVEADRLVGCDGRSPLTPFIPSKNPNGAFGAIKMRKNARAKQRETTTRNQDENENWGRKGRKIGGLPFYVAAGGRIAI